MEPHKWRQRERPNLEPLDTFVVCQVCLSHVKLTPQHLECYYHMVGGIRAGGISAYGHVWGWGWGGREAGRGYVLKSQMVVKGVSGLLG